MNILIIPSWYPNPNNPIQGIFVDDQVRALASAYPNTRFFVSAVCPFVLPLERFQKSIMGLRQYRKHPSQMTISRDMENLWTLMSPVLEWTPRFLSGNYHQRHKIHSMHLRYIRSNFGPIDLIHAHVSYPAGYSAMQFSQELSIPYIITEHMGPFPFHKPHLIDQKGHLTKRVRLPLTRAKRVIAVSEQLAETMIKFGLPTPDVIPNLVDEDRFYPVQKQTNQRIELMSFSSISREKGYDILIQAFSRARLKDDRLHLTIAGSGPDLQAFKAMTISEQCNDAITWFGPVDRKNVPALYNRCDVFILMSRHESFGIVFIEAMACGKPVIASRCGGPESFVNDKNGLLVPLEDPEAASRAILDMAGRYTQYDPNTIRKSVLERFSKKTVSSKIMDIYLAVRTGN